MFFSPSQSQPYLTDNERNFILYQSVVPGECGVDNGCHPHAECSITEGNMQCECREGYAGDGFTCLGLYDDDYT